MALFGKKKYEEEDIYEDEERLPSRRKFRDLKPENRKLRKLPPKPWTKKERLFILSILIISVLISGVLAAMARDWKLPGISRITNPFLKNDIVINNNLKNLNNKNNQTKELFINEAKQYSGIYSFYLIRLEDGIGYGLSENEKFEAASLLKLPVIFTLFSEAEKGNLTLDSKYVLKDSDKIAGAGILYNTAPGSIFTYRELARLMGKQSDRTAFAIIKNVLGDDKINNLITSLGLSNTSLADSTTTPYDMALMLKYFWENKIVKEKSRDEILDYLTDTIYENWLPKGIPQDIKVAHKVGVEVHVINDAGIILSQKPLVFVVMTKGIVENEANLEIPKLVKMVYDREIK